MAKLHSELRIKAVDNIIGGTEGDPVQYSDGDIVYDLTSGKFKKLDTGSWVDAVTGVSADLSSTSAAQLADINYNSVTLDNANGGGKILAWDESLQAWAPIDPVSGATDQIIEGDTKVEVIDTGSDGRIEFITENVKKWEITTAGHILPATNDTYDIGSAEKKVRDFYLSSNSLWIGDEHKISIDNGVMKFRRRKFASGDSNLPASLQAEVDAKFANPLAWSESSVIGIGGAGGAYTTAGLAVPNDLSQMTLAHWEVFIAHVQGLQAADGTSVADFGKIFDKGIQSLFKQDTDFVDNFQPSAPIDSIFGFANTDANGVTLSDSAGEGKTLVWNQAVGVAGAFVPADPYKASFASTRIAFDGNPNVIALHTEIQDKDGGRIVFDTANFDNINDAIQLDLSQMYNYSLKKTMNFEIYSKGTQPFSVEVINPASGPSTGQQVLNSDIQADLTVAEDANASIDIGEGQMLIIYCDGASWWHEIRSGL